MGYRMPGTLAGGRAFSTFKKVKTLRPRGDTRSPDLSFVSDRRLYPRQGCGTKGQNRDFTPLVQAVVTSAQPSGAHRRPYASASGMGISCPRDDESGRTMTADRSMVFWLSYPLKLSVPEMAHPGENHRDPQPVGRLDHGIVAHGSSRLDHSRGARLYDRL